MGGGEGVCVFEGCIYSFHPEHPRQSVIYNVTNPLYKGRFFSRTKFIFIVLSFLRILSFFLSIVPWHEKATIHKMRNVKTNHPVEFVFPVRVFGAIPIPDN